MKHGTRAGAVARVALGILLLAGGIAMLFIPGPGLLVMLFGLGLLGGQSQHLARALDRVEPAMRRIGRRLIGVWKRRSRVAQVAFVVVAVAIAGAAAYGAWTWLF